MEEEKNVDTPEVEEVEEEEEAEEEIEDTEADEVEEPEDPYAGLSHEDAIKRLKKAEKAIAKHKQSGKPQPKPTTKQPKSDEIPEWGKQIIQSEEKRSFGYEHQLSPEQVDAVFRFNGGTKPDDNVLERPEVKAMVKALQSKDRVAANTPRGGTGVVYKGKSLEAIISDPKASKADKQGAFEAARKKHGVG